LHFEEKENELVTTEVNDAKVITDDVSMSTERQEFVSCENQNLFLDEGSIGKLIAQLELGEDGIFGEDDHSAHSQHVAG
jgi:hypothetical protein